MAHLLGPHTHRQTHKHSTGTLMFPRSARPWCTNKSDLPNPHSADRWANSSWISHHLNQHAAPNWPPVLLRQHTHINTEEEKYLHTCIYSKIGINHCGSQRDVFFYFISTCQKKTIKTQHHASFVPTQNHGATMDCILLYEIFFVDFSKNKQGPPVIQQHTLKREVELKTFDD